MSARRSALLVMAGGLAAMAVAPIAALAAPPDARLDQPAAADRYVRQPGTRLVAVGDDPDDVGVEHIGVNLLEPVRRDPACNAAYDSAATSRTYEAGTDPAQLELVVTFPCNLSYQLEITVRTQPGPGPLAPAETSTVKVAFGVAIPPAPVADLRAGYAEAERLIRVTWRANTEADLAGYLVERSVGGGTFEPVAELGPGATSYDDDDLQAGRSYAYRMYAVRAGPDDQIPVVASSASTTSTRTPDPASGPIPEPPPTTAAAGGGGSEPDLAGFTRRVRSSPTLRRGRTGPTTATTRDTGFSDVLPFDADGRPRSSDPGGDDAAVVADLDDEDAADRRALLEPLAAGLALAVGAAHLRFLIRRASALDEMAAPVTSLPPEEG